MDSTEPGTLRFSFLELRRQFRRFLDFQNSIDVARRAPIWMSISGKLTLWNLGGVHHHPAGGVGARAMPAAP